MYNNDSILTCTTVIPYVENTLENIYMSNNLFTKFQSTLFQSKYVFFSYYFKQYIENTVDHIHHPAMMSK